MSFCDICDDEVVWVSCCDCQETDKVEAYQNGEKKGKREGAVQELERLSKCFEGSELFKEYIKQRLKELEC